MKKKKMIWKYDVPDLITVRIDGKNKLKIESEKFGAISIQVYHELLGDFYE